MAKYYECPGCGAALDPGEKCDCRRWPEPVEMKEKNMSEKHTSETRRGETWENRA